MSSEKINVSIVETPIKRLYPESESGWLGVVRKSVSFNQDKKDPSKDKFAASHQAVALGIKDQPFDMVAASELILANTYHARCIRTKRNSTVGLGHVTPEEKKGPQPGNMPPAGPMPKDMPMGKASASDQQLVQADQQLIGDPAAALAAEALKAQSVKSKAAKILDPLCENTWQEVLNDICEDYWSIGNAYLEVVRRNGEIVGLHHIPGAYVFVVIENRLYDRHYVIRGDESVGGDLRFAVYGDLESFTSKDRLASITSLGFGMPAEDDTVSELIHFRQASSLSRWYGYPDYIACTPAIELDQGVKQHNSDFFQNGGRPDFATWILGAKLPPEDFAVIKNALQRHVGPGNSRKNLLANIDGENIKVQIDKLAIEGKSDSSMLMSIAEVLSLEIVAAHGVPPLLAGIPVPGKLGANNEFPNALMAFQTLIIGQAQHDLMETLGRTLGDETRNGGLGLKREDFEFKTITSVMDKILGTGQPGSGMQNADTIGRMRQTVPEAGAQGRDISAGVKK